MRKLALSRTTIRVLTLDRLRGAAGGSMEAPATNKCQFDCTYARSGCSNPSAIDAETVTCDDTK